MHAYRASQTISWAISDAMVCDAALLPELSLLPIQSALMGAMLGSFSLSVDRILTLLALWEMLIVVPFLPSAGILDQGRVLCPHDDGAPANLPRARRASASASRALVPPPTRPPTNPTFHPPTHPPPCAQRQ